MLLFFPSISNILLWSYRIKAIWPHWQIGKKKCCSQLTPLYTQTHHNAKGKIKISECKWKKESAQYSTNERVLHGLARLEAHCFSQSSYSSSSSSCLSTLKAQELSAQITHRLSHANRSQWPVAIATSWFASSVCAHSFIFLGIQTGQTLMTPSVVADEEEVHTCSLASTV